MRSSISARLNKGVALVCAATLCCGLIPTAAFAASDSLSLIPEGGQGTAPIVSGAEGGDSGVLALRSDDSSSVDGGGAASTSEDVNDSTIINQTMPLEVVAQRESTHSYFLAQTLESTKTVPVVSANLPLDKGMSDVIGESTVVGSFTYRGITYAIEPGGETVAIVAADYAKLPFEFVDAQVIVLPSMVASDSSDYYTVSRIANSAFSGLTAVIASESCEHASMDFCDQDQVEACFCGIAAITVPASVVEMGEDAFTGFDTLQNIIVSEDNPVYDMYDGCLYDADLTALLLVPEGRRGAVRIAPSATNVASEALAHCSSVETLIVDPDSVAFRLFEEGDARGMLEREIILELQSGIEASEGAVQSFSYTGSYERGSSELLEQMLGTDDADENGARVLLSHDASLLEDDALTEEGYPGVDVVVAVIGGANMTVTTIVDNRESTLSADDMTSYSATSTATRGVLTAYAPDGYYISGTVHTSDNGIPSDVSKVSSASTYWYTTGNDDAAYLYPQYAGTYYSGRGYCWLYVYDRKTNAQARGNWYYDSARTQPIKLGSYGPSSASAFPNAEHIDRNIPTSIYWKSNYPAVTWYGASFGGEVETSSGVYASSFVNSEVEVVDGVGRDKFPTVRAKEGMKFLGWTTDQAGASGYILPDNGDDAYSSPGDGYTYVTYPDEQIVEIIDDTAFYAVWAVDITWDASSYGGKVLDGDVERDRYVQYDALNNAETNVPAVKDMGEGWTFRGWAAKDEGGDLGTPSKTTVVPVGDTTYYALWGVDATWQVDDQSNATFTIPGVEGAKTSYTQTDILYDERPLSEWPTVSEREGYAFAGWKSSIDGKIYKRTDPVPPLTQPAVFTTVWAANASTVTFEPNIDDGPSIEKEGFASYDAELPDLDPSLIPAGDGFVFSGYFDAEGRQYYGSDGKPTVEAWDKPEDTTLYAHWRYRIFFDKNDDEARSSLPEGEAQADGTVKVTLTGGTGTESVFIHDYDSDAPWMWATWHGKASSIAYPTVYLPGATRANYPSDGGAGGFAELKLWTFDEGAGAVAAGVQLTEQNALIGSLEMRDGVRSVTLTADWKGVAAKYTVRLVADTRFPGADGIGSIASVAIVNDDARTTTIAGVPYGSLVSEGDMKGPVVVPVAEASQHVRFAGYYGKPAASDSDFCYIGSDGTVSEDNHVLDLSRLNENGEIELYARWVVASYDIAFELTHADEGQDAKLPDDIVGLVYGASMPALQWNGIADPADKLPYRTGYAFDGYFDENGIRYYTADLEVDPEQTVWHSAYDATVLRAGWVPLEYEVEWMLNYSEGGEDKGAYATSAQTFEQSIVLPQGEPVRPGFSTFDGWFTEPSGGERVSEATVFFPSDTEQGSVTRYYARYSGAQQFSVKLLAGEGGSFGETTESAYAPDAVWYAYSTDGVTAKPVITAPGNRVQLGLASAAHPLHARLSDYSFVGWREVEGSWTEENAGSSAYRSVAETMPSAVYGPEGGTLNGEKRAAGTLVGDEIPAGIMGNRAFVAVWESATVPITLNLAAVSVEDESVERPSFDAEALGDGWTLTPDGSSASISWASPYARIDLSEAASCKGYQLVGFGREGDAATIARQVLDPSEGASASALAGSYTAVWKPCDYTVMFHANYGRDGEPSEVYDKTVTVAYDETLALPYPGPSFPMKDGVDELSQGAYDSYAFKWWGTAFEEFDDAHKMWRADAEVPFYEVLASCGEAFGSTVHLYAQWASVMNVTVPLFVNLAVDPGHDWAEVVVADWDATGTDPSDDADAPFLGISMTKGSGFKVHSVACEVVNEFVDAQGTSPLVTDKGAGTLGTGGLYLTVRSGENEKLAFDLGESESILIDGRDGFSAERSGLVLQGRDASGLMRIPLAFGLEFAPGTGIGGYDFANGLVKDDASSKGSLARIVYTIETLL